MKNLILMAAILAAYIGALAYGEATFRGCLLAECPSGTAVRVCDRVEREMQGEPFGRACVALTRLLRRIGGAR